MNLLKILNSLRNHYYGKDKIEGIALTQKMKEVMREFKISRDIQRRLFSQWCNTIIGSERWFNLGAVIKSGDKNISPKPEDVENVFDQAFSYNDKKYNFITSNKKMDKAKWTSYSSYHIDNATKDEAAFAYHSSTFTMSSNKKIFLFCRQQHTGRAPCKIKIWIDGKEVTEHDLVERQNTPHMVSLRLKKGEHRILIRADYTRGWDLTFHIGDTTGMPLDIVSFPRSIPLK